MSQILVFFLFSSLTAVLLYLLGAILRLLAKSPALPPAQSLFWKLFSGWLCSVVLFSLWCTHGKTINILIIFLSIPLIVNRNPSGVKFDPRALIEEMRKEAGYGLMLLMGLFLFLMVQIIRSDYLNPNTVGLPWWDFPYYISVAEYLRISGVENMTPWYKTFDVLEYCVPYHYGDLWFLSYLTLFPISSLSVYNYVFTPLVMLFVFSGFLALVDAVSPLRKRLQVVVLFFLVFNCGVIPFRNDGYNSSVLISPKCFVFYIAVCAFGLFCLKKEYLKGFLTLFILSILYVIYLPLSLAATVLLSLYLWVTKRRKESVLHVMLGIACTLGIILFYYFFGNPVDFIKNNGGKLLSANPLDFIVVPLKVIARFLMQGWLYYIPLTVVIVLYRKELLKVFRLEERWLFPALIISFILCGLIMGAVLYISGAYESDQYTLMVINQGITLLFVFALGHIFNSVRSRRVYWLSVALVLIQSLYSLYYCVVRYPQISHTVSREFLQQVEDELKTVKNPIGGYYSIGKSPYANSPHLCFLASFLKAIRGNYWPVTISLSDDLEALEWPDIAHYIKASPFYSFVKGLKDEGRFISMSDARVKFIKKYGIRYLVVDKTVDLEECASLTQSVIEDKESGIKVLVFRP